jgi:hypothetical protein
LYSLIGVIFALIFIGCDNGNNSEAKMYTVTIGTLTNANGSTITANPTIDVEGTEITLTITPSNNYQLKTGTLKYGTTTIDEVTKKFNLPAENVTITAEFETTEMQSPYAGTWESNQYDVKMELMGDLTFEFFGKNEEQPWKKYAKGSLQIDETQNVTFTVTHKWIESSSSWSNNPEDLNSMLSFFGGSLILTGTVDGSTTGSIMLGHLVKK